LLYWGCGHIINGAVIVDEEIWKGPPQKVKVLYSKQEGFRYDPEYHGTRETLWEAGGTTLQG